MSKYIPTRRDFRALNASETLAESDMVCALLMFYMGDCLGVARVYIHTIEVWTNGNCAGSAVTLSDAYDLAMIANGYQA